MQSDPRHSAVRTAPAVPARAAAGLIALAALLGAAGCDLLRDATAIDDLDRSVAVHAIAWAGTDTVRVLVTRVVASSAPGVYPVGPVTGAQVRVAGPAGGVQLVEAATEFGPCLSGRPVDPDDEPSDTLDGCYAGRLPAPVVPGVRYTLLAVLPSGDTIRGAAVAPEPPELIAPAEGTRVAFSDDGQTEIDMEWRPGQGTALVYASLTDATPFVDDGIVPGAGCRIDPGGGGPLDALDHADLRLYLVECFVLDQDDSDPGVNLIPWDSVRVRLRVAAFDTAYARFFNEILGESVTRDEAGAGLSGAAGVFTGAAAAERVITVVNTGS